MTTDQPFVEVYMPIHPMGCACLGFRCAICSRHSKKTTVVIAEDQSAGACEQGHGFAVRDVKGAPYAVFTIAATAV